MKQTINKEFKWMHDGVGKGIHLKLYKRLNFEYADKWFMYKPEDETHKILWDFMIQTSHLILARGGVLSWCNG